MGEVLMYHMVDYAASVPPIFWGVTDHMRPQSQLRSGKLTFDERSVVHRVGPDAQSQLLRRARVKGPLTFVSLNSRLESNKERRRDQTIPTARSCLGATRYT